MKCEDYLINELFKFFKWATGKEPDEEERSLIADYVMLGYGFKELKGGLKK